MAIDIPDLMQNVYNFFLGKYRQTPGGTQAMTFLSFESVGLPVNPDSFKLKPEDAAYFQKLAVQRVAALTNVLPRINADTFQHTNYSVDGMYSMLLDAIPTTAEQKRLEFFAEQKAEAEKMFDESESPSFINGDFKEFHLVEATPDNWYDPGAVSNWKPESFSAEKKQTPPPPPAGGPPAVQLNPQTRIWDFRVLPKPLLQVQNNPRLIAQLATTQIAVKPTGMAVTEIKPHVSLPVKPVMMRGGSFAPSAKVSEVSAARLDAKLERKLEASSKAASFKLRSSEAILQRSNLIELTKQTTGQPVTSSNFSLSLRYCIVQVKRPWLSTAYLLSRGWYIPGYKAGELSTGTAGSNDGIFAALPIGFIVVRDLKISANWTDAEFKTASESMAFGPFSTLGLKVDKASSSLVVDGMQIVGWICQVMPVLPPNADPEAA